MSAALAYATTVAPEPALPSLEALAGLTPIPDVEGRSVYDVCRELNAALLAAGLEFEEYEFSDQTRHESDPDRRRMTGYRWILCSAVPGHCEGIYIHIHLVAADGHQRLIALGKSYRWANALAIAAATTRLLLQ